MGTPIPYHFLPPSLSLGFLQISPSISLEKPQPNLTNSRISRHSMPQPLYRHLPNNRNSRSMAQLTNILSTKRNPKHHLPLLIHNHLRPSHIRISMKIRACDIRHIILHAFDFESPLPSLRFSKSDGSYFRVCEDYLGDGEIGRASCRERV